MNQPKKKTAAASSGRAAFARASSVCLSADMVRAQLHRPPPLPAPAPAPAYTAQQRRYQQITRSKKPLVRPQPVAPQDGPLAYYAQARMRAELQYRAQTAHRLHVEKEAAALFAADQKYIHQGSTPEERRRGQAAAIERKIAQNTRDMMQAQPEAAGIASGVGVGMAMVGQVWGSELAIARLVSTARWLGATRTAAAIGRLGTGLSYQSGPLSLKGALNAGKVFAGRAGQDAVLQYAGASIVNANEQYEQTGRIDVGLTMAKSLSGVNAMSVLMAGLPGDDLKHSARNAVVANAYELNYDLEKGVVSKHILPTWASGLNYGQKVAFSVGGDYLAGRFSGAMHKARTRDSYRSMALVPDPYGYALWRQRMWLLHRAEFIGVYGTKISGGVAGSLLEPFILPGPANVEAAE